MIHIKCQVVGVVGSEKYKFCTIAPSDSYRKGGKGANTRTHRLHQWWQNTPGMLVTAGFPPSNAGTLHLARENVNQALQLNIERTNVM